VAHVNEVIRGSNLFDGVIDFYAALEDPARPGRMRSEMSSGDWLHPGTVGMQPWRRQFPLHCLVPARSAGERNGEGFVLLRNGTLRSARPVQRDGELPLFDVAASTMAHRLATYVSVSTDNFRWVSGGDALIRYASSTGRTRDSCKVCGSPVPLLMAQGDVVLLLLVRWRHLGLTPQAHIFVGSNPLVHDYGPAASA